MYDPNAFVVAGFNPGMPVINRPPIGLTDQEILCVIAYLQSLGGTPTVTLQTAHRYYTPPAAPGARAGRSGSSARPGDRTRCASGPGGHAGRSAARGACRRCATRPAGAAPSVPPAPGATPGTGTVPR